MKKYFLLVYLCCPFMSWAQEDAWVYFTDKPQAGYYLNNPLEMLSQRALDRRNTQGIPLDIHDVPIHQPYVSQVQNATGIQVLAVSKWFNCVHVRGSQEAIEDLLDFPFVSIVYFANTSLNGSARPLSSHAFQEVTKQMDQMEVFPYGFAANQIEMLNGHLLHQEGYSGTGMLIAVMDNGFIGVSSGASFQRLHDEGLIKGTYNFVTRNEDVFSEGLHGSLVLSTLGAYIDNQFVGTAPDAGYYLFVTEANAFENPVEESLWVEAAELADSLGVDVINTSLGYTVFDNPAYNYSYSDMNGATAFISRGTDMAFSRGMICVSSAGNSGNSSWLYIAAPADAVHGLAVGAVTPAEDYADFSSIGPSFDGRVKPDVMAQGGPASVATPTGNVGSSNGTSLSAPITAGLVACLWQAFPEATNVQIIDMIKQSAHLFESPTAQMGYGIPDFYQAYLSGLQMDIPSYEEFAVLIYPNPFLEKVQFVWEGTDPGALRVYNSTGQLLYNRLISPAAVIDLSQYNRGLYYYTIQLQDHIISGKLIKQ